MSKTARVARSVGVASVPSLTYTIPEVMEREASDFVKQL